MQNFHCLTLFIWLVSLLTLSVSDEIKTDGTNLTSASNARLVDNDNATKTEHRISAEITSESTNSTKTQNQYVATPSVAGEGGPISINPNTQQTSTTSHLTLDIQTNLSKEEEEDNQYDKQTKYISKIVSRKGANEKEDNISSIEAVSSNDAKPVVEPSTVPSDTHKDRIDTNVYNSKLNITDKHIDDASTVTVNNTSADLIQRNISSSPVTAATVQEHKPKPTATVVGPNSDKEAFIPHTKGSRLGMPKKIDCVLPVIVTLIALPVLGAILYMAYKQCRDCWDKRHYRRMDFLIDGIYND